MLASGAWLEEAWLGVRTGLGGHDWGRAGWRDPLELPVRTEARLCLSQVPSQDSLPEPPVMATTSVRHCFPPTTAPCP
jgi:hypothetical protein